MEYTKNEIGDIEFDNENSAYYFHIFDSEGNVVDTHNDINKSNLKKFRESLKKSEKDKRQELAGELAKDLARDSIDDLLETGEDDGFPDNPTKQMIDVFDSNENQTKAEIQARGALDKMLKFYLSEDFIEKNEYVVAKTKLDEMDLASIIYRIRETDSVLKNMVKLMEGGELSARMFEVYGQISKVFIELLKHKNISMITLEEHYKKIRTDYDVYSTHNIDDNQSGEVVDGDEDALVERGTRELIRKMRKKKELEAEDVDVDINTETD